MQAVGWHDDDPVPEVDDEEIEAEFDSSEYHDLAALCTVREILAARAAEEEVPRPAVGATLTAMEDSYGSASELSARFTDLASRSGGSDCGALAQMLQAAKEAEALDMGARGSHALMQTLRPGFSSTLPLGAPMPSALCVPASGSGSSAETSPSEHVHRACTPVLRRARMNSPDDDGVMAVIPREGERPGEYERRRNPWPLGPVVTGDVMLD